MYTIAAAKSGTERPTSVVGVMGYLINIHRPALGVNDYINQQAHTCVNISNRVMSVPECSSKALSVHLQHPFHAIYPPITYARYRPCVHTHALHMCKRKPFLQCETNRAPTSTNNMTDHCICTGMYV